jgi:precorrin-2 C(20)-methyltransferase
MIGKLIGVGVGPGDPELLTLKAVRLIQSAPVLAYTVDGQGQSYARRTAAGWIGAGQEELPLHFSMDPDREARVRSRREAARQVLSHLTAGRDVLFLTEGDPLLYSTFQHLMACLPGEVRVEVCPGISALNAAAAAAGFFLAVEDETLVVAPAETGLEHLREWLGQGRTVVLFKVARSIRPIQAELRALGEICAAVLVERASTDGEVVLRQSEDWPVEDVPYFSIVLARPADSRPGRQA